MLLGLILYILGQESSCAQQPRESFKASIHHNPHTMTLPSSAPIIVGVGDIKNKSQKLEDAKEPLELMLQAIRKAVDDACLRQDDILPLVDSITVVPPWTWPYPDLPKLIASKLGVDASHLHIGTHGGNQPALLCDEAARRVSSGAARVAIITGGEALASRELTALNVGERSCFANAVDPQSLPARRLARCLRPAGRLQTWEAQASELVI